MGKNARSLWRLFGGLAMVVALGALFGGGLLAAQGCGFGQYDDSAAPQVVDSNERGLGRRSVVALACRSDGGTVRPSSQPFAAVDAINYTASGTCGAGGAFALSVDGCEMFGNFDALGLAEFRRTSRRAFRKRAAGSRRRRRRRRCELTCDATATDRRAI